MKLSTFLKSRQIVNAEFARQIGVHPQSIPRYRSGKTVPATPVMARIREITGGLVDIEDFIPKEK
jgi:hypothetical protein